MAQSSTTIRSAASHKATITGTVISFSQTGTEYKINSSNTTTHSLGNYAQYDLITVSGSANNNNTFTVKSVATNGSYIIVEETVTTESAGASVSLAHVGFVTAKYQGDGYYSQIDGVHTVAYHVSAGSVTAANNFNGSIKMQGSLATTPTEDDWFDIADTTFTADTSTSVSSYNFTGNFVWVRAKCYNWTTASSSVTKILYNH
ncbi:hypothetical protein EB001_08875 [bacterium]|jgi:hypothetical protein|nr:hypothetical protein [bacterium]